MLAIIFSSSGPSIFSALAFLALGQGKEKAPRVPDVATRAVLGAGPQENDTWYQKLGQQGGDNPMSEPEE